jgi:hypothetical protein
MGKPVWVGFGPSRWRGAFCISVIIKNPLDIMINFLQIIQDRIIEIVLPVLVTIGIVSTPVMTPIVVQENEYVVEKDLTTIVEEKEIAITSDQKQEEISKIEIKESLPKEVNINKEVETEQKIITIQEESVVKENQIITLPNGSMVEIDPNGQIIKYIEKVQKKTSETTPIKAVEVVAVDQDTSVNFVSNLDLTMLDNLTHPLPSSGKQILAKFRVSSEEKKTSSKSTFNLNISSGDGGIDNISDFMIIDSNGSVVAGPINLSQDGLLEFTDLITFPKGDMEYTLRGDLGNEFTTDQQIYTTINISTWNIQDFIEKDTFVPQFQAGEMGVYISSQSNQVDNDGNYTVNLNLTSLTDLTSLSVKLVSKEDSSVYEQNPTQNDKNYNVIFANIPSGDYELRLIADATTLIGIAKAFNLDYLVK